MNVAVLAGAIACLALMLRADAQASPDLQGIWTTRWTTPLERMPEWKTLVISPEEGEALTRAFHARLNAANSMGVPARDLVGARWCAARYAPR